MSMWGIQQSCVLCGEREETRNHLFFACPYSFTAWDTLVNRLSGHWTDPDWMASLQFVCGNNLHILDRILMKMAFQIYIYITCGEKEMRGDTTKVTDQCSNWFGSLTRECGIGSLLSTTGLSINWQD